MFKFFTPSITYIIKVVIIFSLFLTIYLFILCYLVIIQQSISETIFRIRMSLGDKGSKHRNTLKIQSR